MPCARKLAAEALGTAFLLMAVVGSGVMGERLAQGNTAVALLANAIATGAALFTLIEMFGQISGAHFNPAVSLVTAWRGTMRWTEVPGYVVSQFIGAFIGVASAHLMFNEPVFSMSTHLRAGVSQVFSEFIASFGLLGVILATKPSITPAAVALYITSAYWFTASTSFANPAVALARAFTHTFSGIRLADVPAFVVAELVGAAAGMMVFGWLVKVRAEGKQ